MSVEEQALRDTHQKATKTVKYASDALSQISNILVDNADFSIGGRREGKFIVNEDSPSSSITSKVSSEHTYTTSEISTHAPESSETTNTGSVVGNVVGTSLSSMSSKETKEVSISDKAAVSLNTEKLGDKTSVYNESAIKRSDKINTDPNSGNDFSTSDISSNIYGSREEVINASDKTAFLTHTEQINTGGSVYTEVENDSHDKIDTGSIVGNVIGFEKKEDRKLPAYDLMISNKAQIQSTILNSTKVKSQNSLGDSSKISTMDKAMAAVTAEHSKKDEENIQTGAYNKNKINMTEVANAAIESAKSSYKDTDFSRGKAMVNKYGALIGVGTLSRHTAIADVKTQLYSRDKAEIINTQNAINNWVRSNGQKVTYRTLSMDSAHTRVIDDFRNNQSLIDNYLKGHGINTRNITVRDIDKMLGKEGRFNYGQTSKFHAGQSKLFNGSGRDKFAAFSDAALRRNTGWAGKANKGGVYIDSELRDVLIEKRFQLEMAPKLKQIQNSKGGIKNTVSSWIRQGSQDTDTMDGYQHAQAVVHGARAGALITEGTVAGVGTAAIKSIELTGRITSATAKTTINLIGKVYAHGDAVKTAKWTTKVSKVNNTLDKVSAASKYIGKEGTATIHRGLKASVGFTSQNSFKKAKIVSGKIGNGLGKGGKWIISNTAGKTRIGRKIARKTTSFVSKMSAVRKAVTTKFASMQLAIYNHTKIIRLPFRIYNKIARVLRGLVLKVAGAFIGLCIIVAVVLTPVAAFTAILPDAFLADDSYATTDNVGNTAIMDMLPVQQDFLREVEAYWDATCTLVDEYGNKLHPHHSAYFARYMGDGTDVFTNLSSSSFNSTTCSLSTGETTVYGIDVLYKTIISMATVATGNEDQDQTFYSKYCCLLLDKILHSGTWDFDNDGVIPVYIYDTGLTDGMVLDPGSLNCPISPGGCGEFLASVDNGWMHTYGDDSNEYSTWLRTSQNYNEWKGWTAFDEGYFEWAQNLWELSSDDWEAINVILPGTDAFGSDFGGSPLTSEDLANIDSVIAEQTDNPKRLAVIESALQAFQQGIIYSQPNRGNTKNEGEGLSIYQDCSSFCWNNIVNAGVMPGISWAKTTMTFASDSHCVNMNGYALKPGDILVNYTNDGKKNDHAMMFLGFDADGKPQTIECGGGYSRLNVASNNAISIKSYSSVSSMLSTRGVRYIVNYFGD